MSLCKIFPLFIALCVAVGGFIAVRTGNSLIMGASIGLTVGFAPLLLLGVTAGLMYRWCPDRPQCICGQCDCVDYKYIDRHSGAKPTDGAYHYKCPHCGREYRLQGGKFDIKSTEGFSPYMEISRWRRWRKNCCVAA